MKWYLFYFLFSIGSHSLPYQYIYIYIDIDAVFSFFFIVVQPDIYNKNSFLMYWFLFINSVRVAFLIFADKNRLIS